MLGGAAWEGERGGGSEVKTLVSGFGPRGFVLFLLLEAQLLGVPALSPWPPAPGTVCPHVPSLLTTEGLV